MDNNPQEIDLKNNDSKEGESNGLKVKNKELSIPEIISILTVGIILLGFFNIYIYYALYDLDITPYLEPSEIIFSFSSLFVNAILLMCIGMLFKIMGKILSLLENRTIDRWERVFRFVIVPLTMIFLFFVFGFIFGGNENIGFVIGLAEIICGIAFAFIYLIYYKREYSFRSKLFTYFFLIIGYLIVRNKTEVSEIVDYKNPRFEVSMNVNDTIVNSGKTFFYIGATKNSVFFWNDTLKKVRSYPSSGIKWIETKYIRKDEQQFHLSLHTLKKNAKKKLSIE